MTPERYQEVDRLCRAALDMDPSERAEYLAVACGGDEELRSEVESLLSYEAPGFVDQPVLDLIGQSLNDDSSIQPVGTMVGHYRLLSLLGRGGMGEVYLAHDSRLERQVAIKMLPAKFTSDDERVRRFEQEARAASALNHPNIITIHEFGEADARRYVVMEHVAGQTLRQRINAAPDKRLEPAEALDVAVQMALALEAAHEAGIRHRDIKPENVMLRRDGLVKVIDFGLAKLGAVNSSSDGEETRQPIETSTADGRILGTPGYMSPEQARGEKVDSRTDIFNLGVTLYEMLAGQAPFAGSSASDVIAAILRDEPATLHETPPEMQRIVRTALQKDRANRYPSMREMLSELKQEQMRLLRTGGEGETETARKPAGSFRWRVAVVGLLVLVAGFFGFRALYSADERIDSIAILPFVNASGNPELEYLTDGMTETLIRHLSLLPKLNVKASSSVFRYKGSDTNATSIGRELNVQAVLNGRVVQRAGQLTLSLELVDVLTESVLWSEIYTIQEADLVLLQSRIGRDVATRLKPRLSGAEAQSLTKTDPRASEAYRLYLQGRFHWLRLPQPGYEKSRGYYELAIEADPNYALAYAGLAEFHGFGATTGLLPPEESWAKSADAAQRALALDDSLPDAYNAMAGVKEAYGDSAGAERDLLRAIELDPNYAEGRAHYAFHLSYAGRFDEAKAQFETVLALEPMSARYNFFLADYFSWTRDYDRAVMQMRRALELDPNNPFFHESLGTILEQKGSYKEAIAEWSRALTLQRDTDLALSLERTYGASGFQAAVRLLWQKKLERLRAAAGGGAYVPAMHFALAYTRLSDMDEATAWLAKASRERNGLYGRVLLDPVYEPLRTDPRAQAVLQRGL